jgi:spore germination cell wall hydrolase CwlJ-like protein
MILESALLCMALNIYHEARGEMIPGQYAVANVTMNRAKTSENVCRVVTEKNQFSWTINLVKKQGDKFVLKPSGYPKNEQAWKLAWHIARYSMANPQYDFTHGATFYHAVYVSPKWRHSVERTKRMGAHIFYKTK